MKKLGATAIALAVPAMFILGGCSSPAASDPDDALIRYDWDADGPAMLALLTTTLELVDGCLMGEGGTFLAFPRDLAEWDAATETLTYGGDTFAVGDTINAGGGGGAPPTDATIPTACELPDNGSLFLIQSTSLK